MAFFKVSITNKAVFAKIEKEIIKDINEILSTKEMLDEVGEFLIDRIKYQARIGRPFSVTKTFPLLKESTIFKRMSVARYNNTPPYYEEGLSNVTLTGALLDSLVHIIDGVGKLKIFLDGKHPGYQKKSGGRTRQIKNQKIKEYLDDKGFIIWDSSIEQSKVLKSRTKTIVLRYIRRALAIRNRLAK